MNTYSFAGFAAVGVGAALGAWCRWFLSMQFNALLPNLPLGTLISNLVGGFLIGCGVAFFNTYAALSPEWRLFVVTGFLGGLTTFSSFSAESMLLLQEGRMAPAIAHTAVHVFGALLCCFLGYTLIKLLRA